METVNQEEAIDRTFTQAEVDAIVGDRLKRERAKYADYDDLKAKAAKFDEMEEASKTELQKAIDKSKALQTELDALKSANAIRDIRSKVAEETGVPANLLTGDSEESCREQAQAIKDYAVPKNYPNVRDGGELQTPVNTKTARDQFAEWSEKIF